MAIFVRISLGLQTTSCLCLVLLIHESIAVIPRFFHGRPRGKGGMLGSPNVLQKLAPPEEQWFTQRLTHFNDANKATWQQRYWYNSTYWKPGGPVFLMIGGEGEADPIWMTEGSWIKYAEEFGAFTFMLEHRFYGKSHPTE